ncbi:MAG: hypothetical protein HC836_33460, partial [Richelia sp. RM2_1_2]|nr:hypothetical protein [Richelia sp. RM2_1_2]
DDHQTGVLTDKLIEQSGLSPQRIVRMAIADLYQKQQAEIPEDKISTLTELITDEASDRNNSKDVVNQVDWESKQQEFESLLQKDTDDTDSEYPEESDIDSEEDVKEVLDNTQLETQLTSELPVSEELDLKLVGNQHQDTAASEDISNKLEMLVQAAGWEEIISITQNWAEELKSTVWKALSEEERQSINELKNRHFENLEKMPQVGDKVIWNDEPQTYV